ELKLEREQEFLQILFANLPVMITSYQSGPNVFEVNKEFERLIGYSSEDLKKTDVMKAVYPDEQERQRAEKFMAIPGSGWMDFEVHTKWGTVVKSTWTNVKLSDNTIIGIGIDITDRIEKEEKLRENEYILEESQKVANLGSYYLDLETKEARTSDVLDKIFGAPEDDPMSLEKWEKMVHPDYQYIVQNFAEAMESERSFSAEYKIVRQDNHEERWVFEKAEVLYDDNGKAKAMIGIIQDITEVKNQQEELIRQQNRLKEAQKIAGVGHFEYNLKTGELMWGEMVYELFGLNPDTFEVTPENFLEMVHPDDVEALYEIYRNIEQQEEMDLIYRVIKPDGTTGCYQQKGSFRHDRHGNPYSLSGTVLDITTLKEIENELRKKEYLLSEAQKTAKIGTYYLDLLTGNAEISDTMRMILGFENDKPVNLERWENIIHPEDKNRVLNYLENEVLAKVQPFDLQYRIIRESDGKLRWIHGFGKLELDENGSPAGMIGTIQDITDRKMYEQELQEMVHIFQSANVGIAVGSSDDMKLHRMNKVYAAMYGYTEAELTGKPVSLVYAPEYQEQIYENIRLANEKGEIIVESVHRKKDGTKFPVLLSLKSIRNPDGEVIQRVASVQDISELKKIQEKLAMEQIRFETAAQVISDVIWDYDAASNTLWWSEGIESVFGYKRDKIMNDHKFWENHIHESDRDRVVQDMKAAENSDAVEWHESYRFIDSSGEVRYVEDSASIIRNQKGEVVRIIGAMVDKTTEKQSEKILKESEEQYRLLFEQNPIPMWIYDTKTYQFLEVNEAAVQKYGYSKDEFYSMTLLDIRREEDIPDFREILNKTKKTSNRFHESRHLTKDGTELIVEVSASDITYKNRRQRLVLANDITRQRKAEDSRLKALVEGEERERRRIANELHDGLGQYLSAVNMNFDSLYEDVSTFGKSEKEQFKHGLDLL
ncbi:MAG: PAS domain S-box protein, partial [Balneolaceae bacterium]